MVFHRIHAMHIQQIIALAMFAMISSITPGPNNMMLMASGVNYGFRRSLPHLAGICIGFPLMVFATGLGLYAVFTGFPLLHTLLKYGGVLYILWLAWKLANTSPMSDDIPQASQPMTFLQAAAFQWVNPKAWVMALSALTAFLPPRHSLLDTAIVAVFRHRQRALCRAMEPVWAGHAQIPHPGAHGQDIQYQHGIAAGGIYLPGVHAIGEAG